MKNKAKQFYDIGNKYSKNVLLGYIDFFTVNGFEKTKLNTLRLLVYKHLAIIKGFYHDKK